MECIHRSSIVNFILKSAQVQEFSQFHENDRIISGVERSVFLQREVREIIPLLYQTEQPYRLRHARYEPFLRVIEVLGNLSVQKNFIHSGMQP